jgi:hypothetical protein
VASVPELDYAENVITFFLISKFFIEKVLTGTVPGDLETKPEGTVAYPR